MQFDTKTSERTQIYLSSTIVTFAKKVMFVGKFCLVCLSVCNYSKTNKNIFMQVLCGRAWPEGGPTECCCITYQLHHSERTSLKPFMHNSYTALICIVIFVELAQFNFSNIFIYLFGVLRRF